MKIDKIEKNIPIPKAYSHFKYPWPKMEVGDSVFIKADKKESLNKLKDNIGPSARHYGKKTGKKFKTMRMRGDHGIRVWRIE